MWLQSSSIHPVPKFSWYGSVGYISALALSCLQIPLCGSSLPLSTQHRSSFDMAAYITYLPTTRRYSPGEPWPPLQPIRAAIGMDPCMMTRGRLLDFWTKFFLQHEFVSFMPNPQPGGPGYLSYSAFYPLTFPAWVTLLVVKLPPA
jgi:hypothetical protein